MSWLEGFIKSAVATVTHDLNEFVETVSTDTTAAVSHFTAAGDDAETPAGGVTTAPTRGDKPSRGAASGAAPATAPAGTPATPGQLSAIQQLQARLEAGDAEEDLGWGDDDGDEGEGGSGGCAGGGEDAPVEEAAAHDVEGGVEGMGEVGAEDVGSGSAIAAAAAAAAAEEEAAGGEGAR